MVALPDFNKDPTLEAMHHAVEADKNSEKPRGYLGASILGDPCERKTYYQYHSAAAATPIEAKGCYAIEDGHRTEALIADRLRMVEGITLWTHDPETGEQFGFTDYDGKFSGHIDGVIEGLLQAPATPHLWENKAVNEKKFAKFQKCKEDFGEKNALENWDITYFVQAQIYMGYFKLTRHYLTVATPGGRDIDSARTEFQPEKFQLYRSKALRIITAKQLPERISERQEFYLCKWCKFAEECWK